MRQRYSGSFSLAKDTTAKEMLHCFALAYFAVTPSNERSIEDLTRALCEDNYSKYDNYIEYPLLPGSKDITASAKKQALELYNHKPSSLIKFELAMIKAHKEVKELKDKQTKRKLTKNQLQSLEDNLKIITDKDKTIKKILNEFKSGIKRTTTKSSNLIKNKLYQFSANDASAVSWVKSAYWTADALGKKNIIGNYSDYIYAHSSSQTSRYIKEQPLTIVASLTSSVLGIDTLKPDMFNPADIYIIKKNSLNAIIDDYKKVISEIFADETSLKYEEFYQLIKKHITDKECIPISLKKSLTPNPPSYLTGTLTSLNEHHLPLVDSYTHIISYLNDNLSNLQQKINDLIHINYVKYKHSIETFDVNFTFNYSDLSKQISELEGRKVILSNEYYSLTTASMTWNALPTNAQGKTIGAYTGGAGFTQVAAILKKYPETNKVFDEIKKHRKNAYLLAVSPYVDHIDHRSLIKIPSVLDKSTILNELSDRKIIYDSIKNTIKYHSMFSENFAKNVYALYLVYLNSFLLYGVANKKEIEDIKKNLEIFVVNVTNEKIKGLIPTDTLRKYGWTGKDKKSLKPPSQKTIANKLKQANIKDYSKRVYQEDRCAKLEALYFYTEGKGTMNSSNVYNVVSEVLNKFFKKQITMTIYGLITKKGSKIFLTIPEFKEQKKNNANLTQISNALGFRTTPYFLIGNGSDEA
jgi:hypothetical protein